MLPALIFIAVVVAFRIIVGLSDHAVLREWANYSPMAALALCGGAFFPKKWAIATPLVTVLLSTLPLMLWRPHPFDVGYFIVLLLSFMAVAAIGWAVRERSGASRPRLPLLLGGAVTGTLLFWILTNTGSYLCDPTYQKDLGGWLQALTVGSPHFSPPAYVFFLRSLVSDLVFTVLIALCCRSAAVSKISKAAVVKPVAA